jgi:hypothetical protein
VKLSSRPSTGQNNDIDVMSIKDGLLLINSNHIWVCHFHSNNRDDTKNYWQCGICNTRCTANCDTHWGVILKERNHLHETTWAEAQVR